MRPRPDLPLSRRGSALILVLWCLLVLGIAVFGVVDIVELSVEHSAQSQLVLEAQALASSGLALGSNPVLLRNDPLLHQTPGPRRQFDVTISSEGARMNLNYVLLSQHREILSRLFNRWGLKNVDADHVADCLYDWVTPGDLPSLNGAKAEQYDRLKLPQRPTGQPFRTFDEVGLVIGMDAVQKIRPNWQDSFTLWSSGPLNVNEAPPDLIAALLGVDQDRVQLITKIRDGKDAITGTPDDVPIKSTAILQSQLGLTDVMMKAFADQISFDDTARRVESVGQAEGIRVMISAVTRLNSSPMQYLLWSQQ